MRLSSLRVSKSSQIQVLSARLSGNMLSNSFVPSPWIPWFVTSLLISPPTTFGIHRVTLSLLSPVISSTEPEAHSPDTEFEGTRIYDLSSNSVIDQPECFRPQTPSSLADYGEDVMGSGDDSSMMPYPNTSEAEKSENGIPDSKRVYPAESSPANFPVKQVRHGSSHSESQTDRHVACWETAQPMTLAPSVTATLASGPSRTIITCSSSMQPTNGARAGTKRKRP
ncbi:hypothetical protein FALCPG4_018604 [Fusarium falciforme]